MLFIALIIMGLQPISYDQCFNGLLNARSQQAMVWVLKDSGETRSQAVVGAQAVVDGRLSLSEACQGWTLPPDEPRIKDEIDWT